VDGLTGLVLAGLDHLAVTAVDVDATIAWYERVHGAELLYAEAWRDGKLPVAVLRLGASRMTVHAAAAPAAPHAAAVTPGSVDVCFRVGAEPDAIVRWLTELGVPVVEGPVPRPAADDSPGISVYVRDPDGNLVELLTTAPGVR
jgi:catechol 2,3-dioxygenase-like lactoylglutathione lyase family enzyme